MTVDVSPLAPVPQPERLPAATPQRPRIWPAVALVAVYWGCFFVTGWMELQGFTRFLMRMGAGLLVALLFLGVWFFSRRIPMRDRLLVFGTATAGGLLAWLLADPSVPAGIILMLGLPYALTAWAVGLVLTRWASPTTRRYGLMTALLLTWSAFLTLRMEGLEGDPDTGDYRPAFHWRWNPTAEQEYVAGDAHTADSAQALNLRPEDWPGFRGPERDGVVRGVRIATDWDAQPPRLLWKQRIGPAWSSVAVVGNRLFTQEQRGQEEAVVCLDADTGAEMWAHHDAARFSDGQGGPGPRATPTFAEGRLYTLGATGILNCFDAATGTRHWTRDIAAEAGATAPIWGFASSPLVVQGVVVVFAGGSGSKNLLAYQAVSGEPAWTADVGKHSYVSPQLFRLDGQEQVLFISDRGVSALAPATGAVLWEHALPGGSPRSLQPQLVGTSQILVLGGMEADTVLIEVTRDGTGWRTAEALVVAAPAAIVQRPGGAGRLRLRLRRPSVLLCRSGDGQAALETGALRLRAGGAAGGAAAAAGAVGTGGGGAAGG